MKDKGVTGTGVRELRVERGERLKNPSDITNITLIFFLHKTVTL